MVSQHPEQPMRMRLPVTAPPAPTSVASGGHATSSLIPAPVLPWRVELRGQDGKVLLAMYEDEHGRLAADFDEARVTEAAREFLRTVLQMAGQLPVPWKDSLR